MPMLRCYNKGCGIEYDSDMNDTDSCVYHPGHPVFHDAKKKWSCCNKYSTDFTEFLSMKGCAQGPHSNEKPKVVELSEPVNKAPPPVPVIVDTKSAAARQPRPTPDAPLIDLKVTVSNSLKNSLDALNKRLATNNEAAVNSSDGAVNGTTAKVEIGTSCKNGGCKVTYAGPESDTEICNYHPGTPIFHEGMKYWSCCQRKTSEFDVFMNQVGCTQGKHNWTKDAAAATNMITATNECRYDWFQMAQSVTLSVYAKNSLPDTVNIRANGVFLTAAFTYDGGKQHFERSFHLFGIIDPSKSHVNLMGTKVEIVMHKGEPCSWSVLELPIQQPSEEKQVDGKQGDVEIRNTSKP